MTGDARRSRGSGGTRSQAPGEPKSISEKL